MSRNRQQAIIDHNRTQARITAREEAKKIEDQQAKLTKAQLPAKLALSASP
jgi:hypothetical protein